MALKKGTRLLLWITAIGVLIFTASIVAVALLWEPGVPTVAEGTWLKARLAGAMTDGPQEDAFFFDPEQRPLYLTELAGALHHAASDPSVSGIYLQLDEPGIGMAGAQELRAGLEAMAAAGKPCVAWSKTLSNVSWYLAGACEEIHMHPAGVPFVIGLQVGTTHYAGTFEKLGVQADYEKVGTYKSAVEAYELTGPSEPTQAMYASMLDSMVERLIADQAAGWPVPADAVTEGDGGALIWSAMDGRVLPVSVDADGQHRASRWTADQVWALIDDPPVVATRALERGLIDGLTYLDELTERMEAEHGEEMMGLREYLGRARSDWSVGPEVAILYLDGAIIDGRSSSGGFGGSQIGDRTVVSYLRDVREDDDVEAVVMRVNSPGGSALASDVIWREVALTDEVKPVVISMGSYAASGGYYISMGARHIVAEPGTLTGSIGVFGGKYVLGDLYEKLGLTSWTIQRGALAGIYDTRRPFNEQERAKIRARMEDFYATFVGKAAEGRGMSYDELDALAQGRVWTGAQALENGLVDELGGLEVAIARAAELAGLEEAPARIDLPREVTFFEAFSKAMEPPDASAEAAAAQAALIEALLGPELAEIAGQAAVIRDVLEREGVAAALPLHLQVR